MTQQTEASPAAIPTVPASTVKCVVWDLDDTLWRGTLLENDRLVLNEAVVRTIQGLDERGILHSIASRNEPEAAMAKLREFGLAEYFLYPQIGWNSKVIALQAIAKAINIGSETLAFVDDQPIERAEVAHSMPEVRCFDAVDAARLPALPEFHPRFVTEDSRRRRQMYLDDLHRQTVEDGYTGPKEDFLATLGLRFTITRAGEDDLQRAEELTVRTHQLNTTGYTYSYEELKAFSQADSHLLLVASLEDKFGPYGKIGLALVETGASVWTIKLLLMSCRVMSRGVGTVLLNFIMREARKRQAILRAELVHNGRNRMMHVTYRFAGFRTVGTAGEVQVLETDLQSIQDVPSYVQLSTRV